ncbi:MAG: amidase [Pseudomonadales bacterium]|nr:amidase [Pseudomonadales bacterium]
MTRRKFLANVNTVAGATAVGAPLLASAQTSNDELGFMTAIELSNLLSAREISSVELTQYFIARIENYDDSLNAVVVRDFDRAMEAARESDAQLSRGEVRGPLHGLPMTIKESYDIAGLPTTWGIPQARNNIAQSDAVVVERFKNAGAHFLGKTNVPINLGDFQSYNAIYGTTNNPWDTTRTPGGSSGGSATALAAGLTGLESGSDIGGSIRNPSHFCGVYGHKPTLGIIPSRGHQPPGVPVSPQDPDLAVVGPLARSAEDLAQAVDIISGPDILTSPGWRLDLPEPGFSSLSDLRVAIWQDDANSPVAREVSDRVQEMGDLLSGLGATVSDSARPEFATNMSHDIYMPILNAMMGLPGDELGFNDYLGLHGQRGFLRTQWQQFFSEWDVLLCPTTATPAFVQDQSDASTRTLLVNDIEQPYFQQVFWAGLATVSYLPSTVFPTGLSRAGLPIGLQAISAEFNDKITIEFARLMAQEIGGFQAPNGYI